MAEEQESVILVQDATSLPVILSLETATLGGSVFLGRGETLLATRSGNPEVSHSNSLLKDISDSLDEAGLSLQDVDLFACASGPGSFTGLRIGIATLKAFAATLSKPAVGIPTLQAVARAAGPSSATVALLPAGRGEVFAQMFSVSDDHDVVERDAAAHLSPQKLVEKYAAFSDITWAGGGADSQREFLKNYAQQHGIPFTEDRAEIVGYSRETGWKLAKPTNNLAQQVAALALQVFRNGKVQSRHTLNAIYVRPSDAELKEQWR